MVATIDGTVRKFVTKERWKKTQGCIRWLGKKIGLPGDEYSEGVPEDEDSKESPKGTIQHKKAERIPGFLIYVSRTYTAMVPYLKGLHLTLDFWRPQRDDEGWRTKGSEKDEGIDGLSTSPRFVRTAPRLYSDLKILMDLTAFEEAPKICVRAR